MLGVQKSQMANLKRIEQEVIMKTMTWSRDSHGLFDYESRHVYKRTLIASQNCKLVRLYNDIVMLNESQAVPNDAKLLAYIKKNDLTFTVQSPESSEGGEKLWLIVKSVKNSNGLNGYKLNQGDVIKLGRIKFRVKEIYGESVEPVEEQIQIESKIEMQAELPCRFCLSEDYSSDNPLISPCACDGTSKLLHVKCLQNWIRSKCNEKSTYAVNSFYWKSLDCEVCKKPYPLILNVNETSKKNEELINLPKPKSGNYAILESLTRERSNSRIVHIVNLNQKQQIVLGRGHDSDVRISDISVSRSHALITLYSQNPNQLFLEDNNSKFGTLIQIKKGINISYSNVLEIQIGRTVINFQLKRNPENLTSTSTEQNQGRVPQPAQSESSEEEFNSFEEESTILNVKP